MSGEHVVYGFLRPLIAGLSEDDQMIFVHYNSHPPPIDIRHSKNVEVVSISDRFRHWALRKGWEVLFLPLLTKRYSIERILNVSGAITPFLRTPQISLAMNPWDAVVYSACRHRRRCSPQLRN